MMRQEFMIACCAFIVSGCAMARGVHEYTPIGHLAPKYGPCIDNIAILKKGETLNRGAFRVANVAAHGNGYATYETLESALVEEARKVCADVVLIYDSNITKDEMVASYGAGIMIADHVQRPHLYGTAFKYSKTSIGIFFNKDKDYRVEYVKRGSLAEKYGIKEGMRLLAINGTSVSHDQFAIEKEILLKDPGDKIELELYGIDGNKIIINITLK
jgi:S1-C subfamily serine protease